MKQTARKRLASLQNRPDPKQARQWLGRVADHLCNYPNAGPPFQFVAACMKRFLQGTRKLDEDSGVKDVDHDRARSLLYRELGLIELAGKRQTYKERTKKRLLGIKIEKLIKENTNAPWYKIAQQVGLADERTAQAIYFAHLFEKAKPALNADLRQFLEIEMLKATFPHDKSS